MADKMTVWSLPVTFTKVENGPPGKDGAALSILGSYDTLAELQAAHPTGKAGEAYIVGTDLYVWNGTEWNNVGRIKGEDGQPGKDGQPGESSYLFIRYSANANGSNMTVLPQVDTEYIGICISATNTAPAAPASYTWSKYVGADGPAYSITCSSSTITRGLLIPITPESLEFSASKLTEDGTLEQLTCNDNGGAASIALYHSKPVYDENGTPTSQINWVQISSALTADYTTKSLDLTSYGHSDTSPNNDVLAIKAQLLINGVAVVELAVPFLSTDELIDLGQIKDGEVIIANGKVIAESVAANAITAEKIAAGSISTSHIAGNVLDSIDPPPILDADSHYTTQGARINLKEGSIHFTDFFVSSDGDAGFRGEIEAKSGSITGHLSIGNNGQVYIDGSETTTYSLNVNNAFTITPSGEMTATTGTIGGWKITKESLLSPAGNSGLYAGSETLRNGSPLRFFAGQDAFWVTEDGQLHASNADISGTINATGGNISGLLNVGDTILIDGENGALQSNPYVAGVLGWKIDKDGSAEFNNATIRGKLTSTIFEMNTTSAIGGDLYIAPTVQIPKDDITFTLASGSYTFTGQMELDNTWNNTVVLMSIAARLATGIEKNYNNIEGRLTYTNGTFSIIVNSAVFGNETLAAIVNDVSILRLGSGNERKYIYLTATANNSPFLDVNDYEVGEANVLPKVRIGRLDGITDTANGFNTLSGYGLYCNRAYLTGELNLPSAGVTNQTSVCYNGGDIYEATGSPVRVWAGNNNPTVGAEPAPFIVTQDGSLYATKGVFQGKVIAENSEFSGTIRAAGILVDRGGQGYQPEKQSNHFFVGYSEGPTSFDDYVLDMNSAGLSIWEGGLRVYSDYLAGWRGDTLDTNLAVLPYGYNKETNPTPFPYIAAIDNGRLMTRELHNISIYDEDGEFYAEQVGIKDGRIYFGALYADTSTDYLSYEAACYENLSTYGFIGTDGNSNINIQSKGGINLTGAKTNVYSERLLVQNNNGYAEISLDGAIMRQVQDNSGSTIGLNFVFE